LNRVDFAELLGITRKTAGRLVDGTKEWTYADVDAVANALDLDPDMFLVSAAAVSVSGGVAA